MAFPTPDEVMKTLTINSGYAKWEAVDASDQDYEEPERQNNNLPPVELSLKSTSTINPDRPRTWAAGYALEHEDDEYGTMTVVFRDDKGGTGVWWNYYDVPRDMWTTFKGEESKGRYLKSSGLDEWHNMGLADRSKMGAFKTGSLDAIVTGARNFQRKSNGEQREYTGPIKKANPTTTTWNSLYNTFSP